MIKPRLSLILFLCFPFLIFSQKITPEVIATAGDFANGTGFSLAWTVGEVAVTSYTTPTLRLTEGFHQPDVIATNILNDLKINFSIYPNPAKQSFHIDKGEGNQAILQTLSLVDVTGKVVFTQQLQTWKTEEQIFIPPNISKGVYFIQVTDDYNKLQLLSRIVFY